MCKILELGQNYNSEYSLAKEIKYETSLKTLNQLKQISKKNLKDSLSNIFRINKKFQNQFDNHLFLFE